MPLVPDATTRLLAIINQANPNLPVPVASNNLYFGNARLTTNATDGATSTVPTVGVLGSVYGGYVDFTYKRLNLSTIYDEIPIMSGVGASTLYGMLGIVNQFLGLNMTENDVVDTDVATLQDGASVNINIQSKPGSLGYTGALVLQYNRVRPPLYSAVRNNELNVQTYDNIDPTLLKRDIGMMMWNVDMSPYGLASLVGSTKAWKNDATIAAIMKQQFNITDWPASVAKTLTDYATSQYTGANTAFERVIVQTGIVGSTYIGTALFHYNPI